MKVTYPREPGKDWPMTVRIDPDEQNAFNMVKVAAVFGTPISSPGGNPADPFFKHESIDYVFEVSEEQYPDFDRHMEMECTNWFGIGRNIYGKAPEDQEDERALDQGLTPPSRLNRQRVAVLFNEVDFQITRTSITLLERKSGLRAIADIHPQRDIERSEA